MSALPSIFYNIFTRHISFYSEAICRLPQTLIIYESNNSVHKPESTNRIPLTLTTHDRRIPIMSPKPQIIVSYMALPAYAILTTFVSF